MTKAEAIKVVAKALKVEETEALVIFEERVGIKMDSGISEGAASRQAYQEYTGQKL